MFITQLRTNYLYQLKTSEQKLVTSNTRDSIATLLLTRSVVVIATAAESAPYASTKLKHVKEKEKQNYSGGSLQ